MTGKKSGHNLLEVIIASFIFSVAALSFVGVWSHFYSAVTHSRNRIIGNALARGFLEEKIAWGYQACVPTGGPVAGAPIVVESEFRGRPSNCEFNSSYQVNDATTTFRRVQVSVAWKDHTGQKDVRYEAYLYRTN